MIFAAGLAGQIRQGLKRLQVIRSAVRIAGVIDGVNPEHQPFRLAGFRQAQPDGDEHRVATGHVGGRDHPLLNTIGGHVNRRVGEGRPAPGGQVHADAVVFRQPEVIRHRGGCL